MKKIAALLLATVVSGASLSAQEESNYSITVDFPYVSEYVFRGIKYAEESIQPSIELASGDFYAGLWTNQPVISGTGNEFDFYMGYGYGLSDTWSLDLGATYYYYPETSTGDEQFEPFVGVAGDFGGGFNGSGYYFYEAEFEVSTFQFDLGYSIEMTDTSTFDLAATYGFVSADTDYTYHGASVTLNYTLNDVAGSYLGMVYADNDIGAAEEGELIYLIAGISVGF